MSRFRDRKLLLFCILYAIFQIYLVFTKAKIVFKILLSIKLLCFRLFDAYTWLCMIFDVNRDNVYIKNLYSVFEDSKNCCKTFLSHFKFAIKFSVSWFLAGDYDLTMFFHHWKKNIW